MYIFLPTPSMLSFFLMYLHNSYPYTHTHTGEEGMDHYEVQARLSILDKQFKTAESIYLDNNQLDAAMEMYQDLHKWDEGKTHYRTQG